MEFIFFQQMKIRQKKKKKKSYLPALTFFGMLAERQVNLF